MTACMCGHFDWVTATFTAPAAALAWWGVARSGPIRLPKLPIHLFTITVALLASAALLKNVADILWFGHGPLLRGR